MRTTLTLLLLALTTTAHAWDGLGHRIVAENAALLVQDDGSELGALLGRHRFELGAYSIWPDEIFRRHSESESTLHYCERDTPHPKGHLRERIQQLSRLARNEWPKRVSGTYQSGNAADGDTKRVFTALYYLGVLAHYTGDAAVPFHATADSNGFAQGLGGIHFFFEGDCVGEFEPELAPAALALAREKQKEWLAAWGQKPVTAVLDDSLKAVAKVEAADRPKLLEPSSEGHFAKRPPAKIACADQREILVERLAKGAVLTAELWRRSVPAGIDWSASRGLQLNDLMDGVTWIPFP
jgi:hypothetical protein